MKSSSCQRTANLYDSRYPGLSELLNTHLVTSSVADTIAQWHNAGGMVQFYDFSLEEYINVCL